MANCKCCGKCKCNRFIESVSLEFLNKKISIPVNKTISQLKCYEYWYLGDATGYYQYDDDQNPVRFSYKNQKFKITFNTEVAKFKLDSSNTLSILKYGKLLQTGNTIYIEMPDERLAANTQVVLSYKNFKIYFTLEDEFQILQSFKSSGIPELQDLTVEDLSEELPPRQPLDEFINSANVDSYFEIDGGTGSYKKLYAGETPFLNYYACATVESLRVDTGMAYVETRYTGFLIIFSYNDFNNPWNSLRNGQQIEFFPTYYTTYNYDRQNELMKYKLAVNGKGSNKCNQFGGF